MAGAVELNIIQFSLVYLLLIIALIILKKSKIDQTKLLLVSSIRMTIQLILAGLVMTYIFENPHPIFTVAYIAVMIIFAINHILHKNPQLNKNFKVVIALSLGLNGIFILVFFIMVIVGVNIFNPQYTIPIGGMVIGNSMTGLNLALKVFGENIVQQKVKIESLTNLGASPKKILSPFVNNAIETALVPTLNSMMGMGIVFLPGTMTGQILSGTLPMTSIMYQIAIMISICASTVLSVFFALNFGYKTLYNGRNQFII
ncbi:MAG: ABC transporter permease [Methanobacteriaceae archaeon]